MRKKLYLYALYSLFLLSSCADKKPQQELTPWGTPVGEVDGIDGSEEDGNADGDGLDNANGKANRQDFLSKDNKMLKHGIFFGETLGHIEYFQYICTRLSDKK